MPVDTTTGIIAHAIQLAIAPVFLLTGIGGLLGVMEFFGRNLRWLAGGLFVAAMLAVICGLSCFLREVYLPTHTTIIDPARYDVSR